MRTFNDLSVLGCLLTNPKGLPTNDQSRNSYITINFPILGQIILVRLTTTTNNSLFPEQTKSRRGNCMASWHRAPITASTSLHRQNFRGVGKQPIVEPSTTHQNSATQMLVDIPIKHFFLIIQIINDKSLTGLMKVLFIILGLI